MPESIRRVPASSISPIAGLDRRRRRVVLRTLKAMDSRSRNALALAHYEGLDLSGIAAALGVAEDEASRLLRSGRASVIRALREEEEEGRSLGRAA